MYKSRLQELCHQRSWRLPEYETKKDGPDHSAKFTATVTVNGECFQTQNTCKSSKEAQNDAARIAFDHFTNPEPPLPQPSILLSFDHFPQPSLLPPGVSIGSTDVNMVLSGSPALQQKTQEICQTPETDGTALHVISDDGDRDLQYLYKNHLQNYAQKKSTGLPVYSSEREGPPHASRFKCRVTIGGQTFESPEFFSCLKDAENAVAKVALTSLVPDGVKEDDTRLYKNLLQELTQKEGFHLPVYNTNASVESHVPVFFSTVEIYGEVFEGHEAGTKKQAEMNAAKLAYTTLKERKSTQRPLIGCPQQEQEAIEFSTFSVQPNLADLQPQVGSEALTSMNPCIVTEGQAKEDTGGAEFSRYYSCGSNSASSLCDSSTNLAADTSLAPTAGTDTSSYKRVVVCPRMPNMTSPKGCTMLPMNDDQWVAYSQE